jgi:hypothetical protein
MIEATVRHNGILIWAAPVRKVNVEVPKQYIVDRIIRKSSMDKGKTS